MQIVSNLAAVEMLTWSRDVKHQPAAAGIFPCEQPEFVYRATPTAGDGNKSEPVL
jgi:hypothetical protein